MKQIKAFTMTYFFTLIILATGCSQHQDSSAQQSSPQSDQLYSTAGKEYKARFEAVYNTRYRRIEDLQPGYLIDPIRQTTKFLFGPLTYRSLGGVQKGEKIIPHPELATLQNGRVVLPYSYEAVWMVCCPSSFDTVKRAI